ncbi:MAG: nitrogenase iron protein [Thermoprotei archaeon]|nr:MAG: nitrogenase iron protein [Thermoprotei archaeon]
MKKIAFYGKGGIGKSTISTNVAAAIADKGLKVMVKGCDPKTDCTRNLRGHVEARPLLDFLRDQWGSELDLTEILTGKRVTMDDLVKERVIVQGYGGTICIEIGGPEPGIGCAGRGIIVGVDILRTLGVFELYKPDVVLFDVPGDIVCGGLALPLRRELADQVYVITSSEVLPLHAANNLCKAIRRFATRGGSKLGGLIYNARGFIDRPEIVEEYARRIGAKVIGKIPRTHLIPEAEAQGKTVIESFPNSDVAMIFREVADNLMKNEEAVIPRPLSSLEFEDFSKGLQTL